MVYFYLFPDHLNPHHPRGDLLPDLNLAVQVLDSVDLSDAVNRWGPIVFGHLISVSSLRVDLVAVEVVHWTRCHDLDYSNPDFLHYEPHVVGFHEWLRVCSVR